MNLMRVVIFVMIFCITFPALAQITMQFTDFPYEDGAILTRGMGDNFLQPGLAGENLLWDYSSQPSAIEFLNRALDPDGQPGAEYFPAATLAVTTEYQGNVGEIAYWRIEDNAMYMEGFALISGETAYPFLVETNGPMYSFPIVYGDSWDFVSTTEIDQDTHIDSTRYIVDAWGTITDAAGTFNCLRLRLNNTHTVLPDNEVETKIKYRWIAQNWGEVYSLESEDNETDPNYDDGNFERISGIEGWVGVAEREARLVRTFELLPAYPNPFNAQTTLNLSLPTPGMVHVAIYNTLGQHVATVADGVFAPGAHRLSFDAAVFSSGIYFVRATTPNHIATQRITVLK